MKRLRLSGVVLCFLFAVIGAAAFLATSMRVPLTAIVLIVEFTQPTQAFLVPVLIAVAGSVATSECIRRVVTARNKVAVSDAGPMQIKA